MPSMELDPPFQIHGHNESIPNDGGFHLCPRIPIVREQSARLRNEHNPSNVEELRLWSFEPPHSCCILFSVPRFALDGSSRGHSNDADVNATDENQNTPTRQRRGIAPKGSILGIFERRFFTASSTKAAQLGNNFSNQNWLGNSNCRTAKVSPELKAVGKTSAGHNN